MKTKIGCRFMLLALLLVAFSATLWSQDNNDWTDWKSAPNFPGIKIRVVCYDSPESDGQSQWRFQFMNTYQQRVALTYQEEATGSRSNPPKFGAPSLGSLDPSQTSEIYTVYLGGSCHAHGRIYIRVVSIKDDRGARMQPKTGASRSAAFGTTAQSGAMTGRSGHSETAAAAGTHKNVVPAARSTTSDLGGTSWDCDMSWYVTINFPNGGQRTDNSRTRQLLTFKQGGQIALDPILAGGKAHSELDWNDNNRVITNRQEDQWQQSGSSVQFVLHNFSPYLRFSGQSNDARTMAFQVDNGEPDTNFLVGGNFRCSFGTP